MALQDRDLHLIQAVKDYRLLTTPQLLRLFADESRDGVYRRLQRLFHHGYLDRIGENPNAPNTYGLGRRGSQLLEVPERKDISHPYVAHQLMVGDFRISLTLACRERGVLLSWRSLPKDLPVRPDGFFTLQFPWLPDGRNRAHFFLEADRSTMSRERFVQKLLAYAAWYDANGPADRLDIRRFRVLTLTRSEERRASLVGATSGYGKRALGLGCFWFSAEGRLATPADAAIFAPIWETPEGGPLRSLLP